MLIIIILMIIERYINRIGYCKLKIKYMDDIMNKTNKKSIKFKTMRYIISGFIIFNVLLILITISSAATSQTPYSGTALKVPGTIQVEDFDKGGEGIAYHDSDTKNNGGAYRTSVGVDIESTKDSNGGYDIGWIKAGEWMEYTTNITSSGTYDIEVRVARGGTGGNFHIEFNGVDKTGTLTIPNTGGWQNWTTIKKIGVSLGAGPQIMKIVFDINSPTGGDAGNINYVKISQNTPASTPSPIVTGAFYVAKDGNDANPGTEALPWRTIQKAANTLVEGQTVYVKQGTYNEQIKPRNSGSPERYITFSAYPGHIVTIDGKGLNVPIYQGLFYMEGLSYIKISGFKIVNSSFGGIVAEIKWTTPVTPSTNLIIEKNYINNIASSAIFVWQGKNVLIDGNEITKAQTMEGLDQQLNEPISLVEVDGFEIKNNKIYDNMFGESIDVKEGTSNGKIHHNEISKQSSAGIYVDAQGKAAHDIEIFSNKIYDGKATGRGIAIAAENGGSLKNVKVYNNLVYNNAATGIDVSGYSTCLLYTSPSPRDRTRSR